MPNVMERLVERYPRLPALLANTSASKLIQLIKDKAIDPVFDHNQTVWKIQSWPPLLKKTAEWVPYFLSGWVRTMPEPNHPVAIAIQEALAESLTQVGIKVSEISTADRLEIIDMTMPIVRGKLADAVKEDGEFRDRLETILGSVHDWNEVIKGGENFLSHVNEKTQAHRQARLAHGRRRFLW